jgi:hypothetical protein
MNKDLILEAFPEATEIEFEFPMRWTFKVGDAEYEMEIGTVIYMSTDKQDGSVHRVTASEALEAAAAEQWDSHGSML